MNIEPKHFGGPHVHDEFEFAGLRHRQISRFFALENSPDINAGLTVQVCNAGAVADPTAIECVLALRIDRGNGVPRCEPDDPAVKTFEKWIRGHEQPV